MSITIKYTSYCPDCNAVQYFASNNTNVKQCEKCGSVLYRNENGECTAKNQLVILQKSSSVVKPGTTGVWNNNAFKVLGRMRAWFDEAVFNFWTIQFSNDEIKWMGEGYGLYYLLSAIQLKKPHGSLKESNIKIGTTHSNFLDDEYILCNKQTALKWELEGEIFIPAACNSFTTWDYSNAGGKYISLFEFEPGVVLSYELEETTFENLQFKNLRNYENPGKLFNCNNCKNEIVVKTYPYAQSCSCNKCGQFYELKNGIDFKKDKLGETYSGSKYISVGSTGLLYNKPYEIIGFVIKEEISQYHYKWREYTLFNPEEGFAFLSEYNGHWIFVKEMISAPILALENQQAFTYGNDTFQLYNKYRAKITTAKGEFPYNVFDDADIDCKEFIAPPYMWVREKHNKEGINWYLGKHISSKEIKKAFQTTVPLKVGIGAVQPVGIEKRKMWVASFIGLALLILTHFFTSFFNSDKLLFTAELQFGDSTNVASFTSTKFTLEKWRSNILIEVQADVNNSWVQVEYELVNTQTGKEMNVENGVEYYSGVEDGTVWTEGSKSDYVFFTRVPAGTYFLRVLAQKETGSASKFVNVVAKYDVLSQRNLWLGLLLFLIFPVCWIGYKAYGEQARWSNSDFSPYNQHHE